MPPSQLPQRLYPIRAGAEWTGLRLKEAVQRALPDLGSRGALLVIRNGLVSLEGASSAMTDADTPAPVEGTLLVDLRHGLHGRSEAKKPRLHERMKVVHEDEHIIVVSKRAGTLVQPVENQEDDRGRGAPLVELLKHYWRARHEPILNPVVVQRLDADTSGLLVLAKTQEAGRSLQRQLKPPRKMRRDYIAFVAGRLEKKQGVWKSLLGRGGLGLRQSVPPRESTPGVRGPAPQSAVTHYKVIEELPSATVLSLRLETGRTHQIRIHCAEAGHPILGEPVYSRLTEYLFERAAKGKLRAPSPDAPVRELLAAVERGATAPGIPDLRAARLALHAVLLSFLHPDTDQRLEFSEPLPPDMESYRQKLAGAKASEPGVRELRRKPRGRGKPRGSRGRSGA